MTRALLDGSPAIDAGAPGCDPADQRGVPRPQGRACDMGAYQHIFCDYDGFLDPCKQCDDGNAVDGDGCSSTCETELLSARKLLLRAEGGGSGSKVLARSTVRRVGVGWGNFSGDHPVVHGRTLRVMTRTGDGFDDVYSLPLPREPECGHRQLTRADGRSPGRNQPGPASG